MGARHPRLNKYARQAQLIKESDPNLGGDDVREGLTAVISVKIQEPQFEGQTKTKLGNSEVAGQVQTVFGEGLMEYLMVPNVGSAVARLLGRRWWSVLPMHLQYFTPSSLRDTLEQGGLEVLDMRSHAKAFSARYYAERLGGYSARLETAAVGVVKFAGLTDRMIAPGFRDRLCAIAIRR